MYVLFYTCLQLKTGLLLSLSRRGWEPALQTAPIAFRWLQALRFPISQILFKLLREEREGEEKEPSLTGCGMSAFAPIPLNGLPHPLPWVPVTARLSSLRLLSFSELREGPRVIRRGQPGLWGREPGSLLQTGPPNIRYRVALFAAHQRQRGRSWALISRGAVEDDVYDGKLTRLAFFVCVGLVLHHYVGKHL